MVRRAIVVWLLVAGWAPWVELRAGSAPAAEDMVEEVVVTASRITRPDYSYSNPVFSVGGDVLRSSGIKDMAEYLANVPALVGSVSSTFTSGGGIEGTNGLTALNLRNLGPQRTLVLVNGRRYIGSPFSGAAFVDIDTLPVALIERVEVLTGGASALYGADGVSGVVNFVMKDRFEGLDISMEAGASSKHDAQSRSAALTYGTSIADERGHFSIALTYDEDKNLYHNRRSFTSPSGYSVFVQNPNNPGGLDTLPDQVPLRDIRFAESSRGGALDITFDGFPEFDADGSVWDGGLFIEPFYQQGGDGQPLVEFLTDLLPDEENYTLNTFFDFDVTENLRFFSEFAYHKNESYAEFEPIFDFVLVILPDSPFIPANVAAQADIAVLNSKDNWDLGVRTDETERETYRGVLGVEREVHDLLAGEVAYTYGETDGEYRTR